MHLWILMDFWMNIVSWLINLQKSLFVISKEPKLIKSDFEYDDFDVHYFLFYMYIQAKFYQNRTKHF